MEGITQIFGGIEFGTLIFWGLILFGSGFFLFTSAFFGVCGTIVYRMYKRTANCNCLLWKHPDNTPEGIDYLELKRISIDGDNFAKDYFIRHNWPVNKRMYEPRPKRLFFKGRESQIDVYEARLKIAQGEFKEQRSLYLNTAPDWDYKEAWWQWWKVTVKWVYEYKNGKGYDIKEVDPDLIINTYQKEGYPVTTAGALAEDVQCSKNWMALYKKPMKLLQTLALGAPILLGMAFVFGIIILGVFLIGDVKGA